MEVKNMVNRSNSERDFIDQMARKLCVSWCYEMAATGKFEVKDHDTLYFSYAMSKKWFSQDGAKILAAGWDTATRFLKR